MCIAEVNTVRVRSVLNRGIGGVGYICLLSVDVLKIPRVEIDGMCAIYIGINVVANIGRIKRPCAQVRQRFQN